MKEKRHDISGIMARTERGAGIPVKTFLDELNKEIEKVKKKGYKGPLRLKHIDGGPFGMSMYITGK